MQRRHAAIALLASAAALPRASRAQVAGPRIGWLRLHDRGTYAMVTERGFLDGLARAALVPGRNCTLVQRSAEGDSRRLRRLARELVAEKPDPREPSARPPRQSTATSVSPARSRALPTVTSQWSQCIPSMWTSTRTGVFFNLSAPTLGSFLMANGHRPVSTT